MFIIARNRIYADLCIAIIWLNPSEWESVWTESPLDLVTPGMYHNK